MVGMPDFFAKILTRFLTRFLARFLTRVFWPRFLGQKVQFYRSAGVEKYSFTLLQGEKNTVSTTGAEKYSFTVLPGRRNTVLQFHRDGEKLEKNHVFKDPI